MTKNTYSVQWKIPWQAQVAQKSWIIKNIYSARWIQGILCFSGQAQVTQKSWMIKKYVFNTVKNSRATLFFRASASCSKILNNKKYIFSTVNSGQFCFSGQAQVTQKSWIIKNTYSVQWIQSNSVFQGKRKLLKDPECKKYIQYSEKFQGNSIFQGKRKLLKNPEYKKYTHYSENFQGNSVFFRASASCSKIVNCEKIFNTVYIHLGAIRIIWASVVCNQDQPSFSVKIEQSDVDSSTAWYKNPVTLSLFVFES